MVKNFLNKVLPLLLLSGNGVGADFQNNNYQTRYAFDHREFFDIHAGEEALKHGLYFSQVHQGKTGI